MTTNSSLVDVTSTEPSRGVDVLVSKAPVEEDVTETSVTSFTSTGGEDYEITLAPPPQEATTTTTTTTPATPTTATPKLDYASIPSFDNFLELVQDKHYIPLPSDWCILVADIEGSTQAIESGRYRDVNTAGAMCIAAVRNAIAAMKSHAATAPSSTATPLKYNEDFPYVFGGDGATLVVPPYYEDVAVTALLNLSLLVQQNYQLHLRVGSLPISEVEEQGATVQVARYEIASGMCIALFRGGGLALADTLVKAGHGLLNSHDDDDDSTNGKQLSSNEVNLDGLSCRWKKIPNKHGCVLSLLVMHNEDVYSDSGDTDNGSSAIYQQVLQRLEEILRPETMQSLNPVNLEAATYKSASEMVEDEVRMHAKGKWCPAFWNRAVEIGLCHVIFKMKKLQKAVIDAPAYTQQMRTHADHRKFDDMIRMVVDCTPAQADAIEAFLKGLYNDNRQVFYGTQRSKHTLMTCLLKDTEDGNHIHFVDGDAGGYALAAKGLKMQLGNYAMAKRGMKLNLNKKKNSATK